MTEPARETKQGSPSGRMLPLIAGLMLLITFVMARTSVVGPPCLSRVYFHIPCPGCGFTRSLVAAWHGELLRSFKLHPLGIPLFASAVFAVITGIIGKLLPQTSQQAGRILDGYLREKTLLTFLALLLTIWVIRLLLLLAHVQFFTW